MLHSAIQVETFFLMIWWEHNKIFIIFWGDDFCSGFLLCLLDAVQRHPGLNIHVDDSVGAYFNVFS